MMMMAAAAAEMSIVRLVHPLTIYLRSPVHGNDVIQRDTEGPQITVVEGW